MRKKTVFVLIIIFCSQSLISVVYKGKSIDGKNFSAQLWLKDEKQRYNVSVVFVKKEARIIFAPNQVLPLRFSRNMHLILYLKDEQIEDPEQVPLLELIPPETSTDAVKDTNNWEIAGYWFMKVNLSAILL